MTKGVTVVNVLSIVEIYERTTTHMPKVRSVPECSMFCVSILAI